VPENFLPSLEIYLQKRQIFGTAFFQFPDAGAIISTTYASKSAFTVELGQDSFHRLRPLGRSSPLCLPSLTKRPVHPLQIMRAREIAQLFGIFQRMVYKDLRLAQLLDRKMVEGVNQTELLGRKSHLWKISAAMPCANVNLAKTKIPGWDGLGYTKKPRTS